MNQQRKGRLMLMLLVFFFALPVAVGIFLYVTDWRPKGSSYGELLEPAQALDIPSLSTIANQSKDANSWKGKWHLVYVAKGGCDAECSNSLHEMRQIHASLAKEIGRLERVWLLDGATFPEVQVIQGNYPDMLILPNASVLIGQMQKRIGGEPAGRLYLVDPLGNLIVTYPHGSDPSGIRKDVMKLLSHSWAG